MPSVHSHKFTKDGVEYQFEVGFDDGAIMDDKFVVTARGKRRESDNGSWQKVDARIEVHPLDGLAEVYVNDTKIGQFRLDDNRYNFSEDDDEAGETLVGQLHEDAGGEWPPFDELISNFPAGDPILGCLIKGALSSAAGQIIRCYDARRRDDDLHGIIRHMARCLGDNIWNMLWVASKRSFKCMIFLGFA